MKFLLSVIAVAVLLQAARSAPYKAMIQDLLDQLQQTKRAQKQQEFSYAGEEDYNYPEKQDYNYADEQGDYYAGKEDYNYAKKQDYNYADEQGDYYVEEQDNYNYADEQQDNYNYVERQQDNYNYDEETEMATIQREFDAAIESWWNRLKAAGRWMWQKAKSGCNLYNKLTGGSRRKVDTEQVPIGTIISTGNKILSHACKYVGKPKTLADIESFLGTDYDTFKATAQGLLGAVCDNPIANKGVQRKLAGLGTTVGGLGTKALDWWCGDLKGTKRQATFDKILRRATTLAVQKTRREKLEEKLGRAFVESFMD